MKEDAGDTSAAPATSCGELPAAYTPLTQDPAHPDLARVLAAWPVLPEHVKQTILALVNAVAPPQG
jgi:hypothetical protein